MSSVYLAFSSDGSKAKPGPAGRIPADPSVRSLLSLEEGARGVIVDVRAHARGRADRLLALGVTPGATVTLLQCFPGVVFLCDQTELAVEREVADAILVRPMETRP